MDQKVLSSTVWTWNGKDLIMLIGSNKIGEGGNANALEKVLGQQNHCWEEGEVTRLSLKQAIFE